MPASMALRGDANDERPPVEKNGAGDGKVDPEDGAGELGAAGADEAGEAQDLAAPEREA